MDDPSREGRNLRDFAAPLAEGGRRGDHRRRAGVQGGRWWIAGRQGASNRQDSPESRRTARRDEAGPDWGEGSDLLRAAEGGDKAVDAVVLLQRRRQRVVRGLFCICAAEVVSGE